MSSRNITADSTRRLVLDAFAGVQELVESGETPLSSEATMRFLFAWRLGRLLDFSDAYRFDFEWNGYSAIDTDDTSLDLLVFTDPTYKVALEFKLPKSSGLHGSNSTQTRAKICRDISRLSYLVRNDINSIRVAYFICVTDEGSYLTEGRTVSNTQYRTYQGTTYDAGSVIPAGEPPNGIARPHAFPAHAVSFEWLGVEARGEASGRLVPIGRFAWLRPIEIAG